MALEKEMETFQQNLPNLLCESGKYVVVSGDQIAGIYGTYEDALKVGYEKYGLKPFLVRKIQAVEQVQYFTRDIDVECLTSP
jgi:hypothetical protein